MGARTLTPAKRKQVVQLLRQKWTHRQIATQVDVGMATVSRIRATLCTPTIRKGRKEDDKRLCAPVTRMAKWEVNWLATHCCKHDVPYLVHWGCFLSEKDGEYPQERVGFLDIEASSLNANFGMVICWCIKPDDGDIIQDCVTHKRLHASLDKTAVASCIEAMRGFDRIVAHYGSRFDLPFIRSRAMWWDLDFPDVDELWQTDTWRIARQKLKLSSNRLDVIAKLFHIETEKTRIEEEHWLRAIVQGHTGSLDYILDHCRRDVLILEAVYKKLVAHCKLTRTSV